MDQNAHSIRKCGKCHGSIPESRDKRAAYCSSTCRDAAAKRRKRGQPVADPISAAEALALMARMAGLEETLRQTSAALVRARASRDEYRARVRKLQGVVEAARKHADSVAAEQAAKTAALREEAVVVRQRLANAVAVQKELPAAREAATDAEKVADYLRRLAEGNAAYGRLRAECEEHKKSLEVHKGRAKADALLQHDWDRLCRWFYQSSKGRPVTESERQILTRWVTWRREQNQQKQAQQVRKKAGTK